MSATPSLAEYRCFVGIDIAAASFTANWTTDGFATDGKLQPKAVTFSQSASGFSALQLLYNSNCRRPLLLPHRP